MAWKFASGEILTAANLNAVTRPNNAICLAARLDTSFSVNEATLTNIELTDTDPVDPLDWHDPASNPDRVTPGIAGWYEVVGWAQLLTATTAITHRRTALRKNGSLIIGSSIRESASSTSATWPQGSATVLVEMNGSTDYVQVCTEFTDAIGNARAMNATLSVKLVYPT